MTKSFIEIVNGRRSTRKFDSKPVKDEDLEQIIEAARLAPSGTNRQPWRFILLKNEEEKERIAGSIIQPFVLEAPVVIVCCLDKKAYTKSMVEKRMDELVKTSVISEEAAGYINQFKLPEKAEEVKIPSDAYIDLGIAVEHMVLMAEALGLGSCWVRLINPGQMHEQLGLPDDLKVSAVLPVGYPAQSPPPRPRLDREDIIIEL